VALLEDSYGPRTPPLRCRLALMRFWHYNALSYEATLTTDEPCHVAFTSDGRALAVTSGNAIAIWSMF
jgi:hypothetical protein